MTKGLPRSLAAGGPARAQIVKQRIPISGSMDITGVDSAVDAGTFVIGGLPEGNLFLLGALANVIVDGTDASVAADWAGDFAIGTVAQNDVDLGDAGEADIIASTELTADSGLKVTLNTRAENATPAILDNTAGDLELNFNLLIDDNEITDTEVGTFTVTGELWLLFAVLGDD